MPDKNLLLLASQAEGSFSEIWPLLSDQQRVREALGKAIEAFENW